MDRRKESASMSIAEPRLCSYFGVVRATKGAVEDDSDGNTPNLLPNGGPWNSENL